MVFIQKCMAWQALFSLIATYVHSTLHKYSSYSVKTRQLIWKIYIVIESLSKFSKYRTDRTKGTEKMRQANKAYTHTHIVSYDKKAILIFLSMAFSLPILNPQSNAGILEQSMEARNRVKIGLSYRPARARNCKPFKEPRNRFRASRAG
jgi:hypothetical protein